MEDVSSRRWAAVGISKDFEKFANVTFRGSWVVVNRWLRFNHVSQIGLVHPFIQATPPLGKTDLVVPTQLDEEAVLCEADLPDRITQLV